MSVWYCIPSARPVAEAKLCLDAWRAQGYKIALWLDDPIGPIRDGFSADVIMGAAQYPGYARAVNTLIAHVMSVVDLEAEWFVTGGDDVWPDPTKRADEIAQGLSEHFYNAVELSYPPNRPPWTDIPLPSPGGSGKSAPSWIRWSTFGVMQPTGDRWHEGKGGFSNAPIDRVCGSPWMGREFCRRINQGMGPLWWEYQHMYVDQEAQEVAERLGIFWQRRDLVHLHRHWGRGPTDQSIVNDPVIPPHLVKWNTQEHWNKSKALFEWRKANGFPGHEPCA